MALACLEAKPSAVAFTRTAAGHQDRHLIGTQGFESANVAMASYFNSDHLAWACSPNCSCCTASSDSAGCADCADCGTLPGSAGSDGCRSISCYHPGSNSFATTAFGSRTTMAAAQKIDSSASSVAFNKFLPDSGHPV